MAALQIVRHRFPSPTKLKTVSGNVLNGVAAIGISGIEIQNGVIVLS